MRSVLLATVAAVALPFAYFSASAQSPAPAGQTSQPSADSLLDRSTPSGETRSGQAPAAAADTRSAEAAPPSAAAPKPVADEQPQRPEPTRSAETAPPEPSKPAASLEPDAERAAVKETRRTDRDNETGVADAAFDRESRPDRRPDDRAAARLDDRAERRADTADRQRARPQTAVSSLRRDERSSRTADRSTRLEERSSRTSERSTRMAERSTRIDRTERTSLRAERRVARASGPDAAVGDGPARFHGDERRASSRSYRVVERQRLSDDAQLDRARRAARRHAMTVAGYGDDPEMYSEGRRVLVVRPYRRIVVVED